jgi:hypothetical protein
MDRETSSNSPGHEPRGKTVLPWHFKASILQREKEYLASGGKMIFPFPEIEIV